MTLTMIEGTPAQTETAFQVLHILNPDTQPDNSQTAMLTLCPLMHLATECNTISALCFNGGWIYGDKNVLSTTTNDPLLCAVSAKAWISTSDRVGLRLPARLLHLWWHREASPIAQLVLQNHPFCKTCNVGLYSALVSC